MGHHVSGKTATRPPRVAGEEKRQGPAPPFPRLSLYTCVSSMEMRTMLRPPRTAPLTLSLVAAVNLGLGACNRRDSDSRTPADDRALAESAAVYEEVAGRFRKVGETPNLQGPESARYDRDLDVWFVSNVNG